MYIDRKGSGKGDQNSKKNARPVRSFYTPHIPYSVKIENKSFFEYFNPLQLQP